MESQPEDTKEKLGLFIAPWFKKQLDRWGNEGILNQNQKDAIKNLYAWPECEIARTTEEKPAIKLVVILQAIGAFLIGIGVISYIAYNWSNLPNSAKLVFMVLPGLVWDFSLNELGIEVEAA